MIGVEISGRLGNQLFQFAFALYLSDLKKDKFFISQITEDFQLPNYFVLPGFNKYINSYRVRAYQLSRKKYDYYIEDSFNKDSLEKDLLNAPCYVKGYFQNHPFINLMCPQLKNVFKVKSIYRNEFENKYTDLLRGKYVVSVHIRRGDIAPEGNPSWYPNKTLPLKYYKDIMLQKQKEIDNVLFLFASDNVNYVLDHFKEFPILVQSESVIIDFLKLSSGQEIIIANSSFSWMAAYLSDAKRIYYPDNWNGMNVIPPPTLYHQQWIKSSTGIQNV